MNIFPSFIRCRNMSPTNLVKILFILASSVAGVLPAVALSPDFYASSSALSEGQWARVRVTEPGMQLISNATLKNLGFSDPDKVNVYGFGGRMLPERLNSSMTDDLPIIPSVRTPQGIVFFGHAATSWSTVASGRANSYTHLLNIYSEDSYYFISDRNPDRQEPLPASPSDTPSGEVITIFTERIAHEQDLSHPGSTGRLLFGEDFRVQNSRNFQFSLPDNTGEAVVTVSFAAKYSGGSASLMLTANNERLPSTSSDQISSGSSTTIVSVATTTKNAGNVGERLNLGIQFTCTGAINTANLNYIEVEYPRQLRLHNDELYFYLKPSRPSEARIEGCSASTVIWDVTDSERPALVDFSLSGSVASFTAPAGYREYVAFNPASIRRAASAAGRVQNQDLHGTESPDMLIIAPDVYRQAAQRVADLHAQTDGLTALVVSPESIYNEFSSGTPDLTAYRKLLKMWYDRAPLNDGRYARYCLIFGRPSYDTKGVTPAVKNCGYPRIPIWQESSYTTNSFPTDDYIGMLDDNQNNLAIHSAKIQVAVGRMPVKSVTEANNAATKLENYVKSPNLGAWRNNVMVIADDQDSGLHLIQAEECVEQMRNNGNGRHFLYEKLYLDSYPLVYTGTGPEYPAAKQRMMEKFAEGVCYVDYIGHGQPKGWGHERLLTWTDIMSMSNKNMPFIYAATCDFMQWDADEVSGAEELWLNPTAGAIGLICPSRSVAIGSNGTQNAYTSAAVFRRDEEGKGMRVGDIMLAGKNALTVQNRLPYGLIGDPAMRLPSPEHLVTLDSIGGTELAGSSDLPELPAMSSVEIAGSVSDYEGNVLSDFNGTVDIQLFDAEEVVETFGNGSNGKEMTYNDRKKRLYVGRAKVKDGHWSTIMTIPMEISGNYSPALLSLYASDSQGREANGSSEQFYIYGFDGNITDDSDGPVISGFYLNSPVFSDGDAVSPSPMLIARFSDPSGINVSDAGLGHSMMVSLDGKTHFDDVALYYTPDDEDPFGGAIAYPLSGIEPGEHELSFTVWDNAANSSSATLRFNVSAGWLPSIAEISTDVNPASTAVNFIVGADGATGLTACRIEVFNLSGDPVWEADAPDISAAGTTVRLAWDLCDKSGRRVPRGIYLYRATLTTPEGAMVSQTRKLAVTAG